MAFVSGQSIIFAAAGGATLPLKIDLSGNSPSDPIFSHGRFTGPATLTWDITAPPIVIPTAGDVVFAIPAAARIINSTAAGTLHLGHDN